MPVSALERANLRRQIHTLLESDSEVTSAEEDVPGDGINLSRDLSC